MDKLPKKGYITNRRKKLVKGSVKPCGYHFSESQRGTKLIICRGFRYRNRSNKGQPGNVWYCTYETKSLKCSASVLLNADRTLALRRQHLHPPPEIKDKKDEKDNVEEVQDAIFTGSVKPDQYSTSGNVLICGGFRYAKVNVKYKGKHDRYWRCASGDGKNRCSASVLINDDQSLTTQRSHCHPPPTKNKAKKVVGKRTEKMKKQVEEGEGSKRQGEAKANNKVSGDDNITAVSRNEYKFGKGIRGSKLILWRGFRYGERGSKVYEGKHLPYWRCSTDGSKSRCHAFVLVNEDRSLTAHNAHSHAPPTKDRTKNVVDKRAKKVNERISEDEESGKDNDKVIAVEPGDYKFCKSTETGSKLIVWRGFHYGRRNSTGRIWRCTSGRSSSKKCRANVLLNDDQSLTAHHSHSHPPHKKKIAKDNVKSDPPKRNVVKKDTVKAKVEIGGVEKKGDRSVDKDEILVKIGEYKFCESTKTGSKLISWRGYRYGRGNKLYEGKPDRNWRCTSDCSKNRCRALVVMNDDRSLTARYAHSHPPPNKGKKFVEKRSKEKIEQKVVVGGDEKEGSKKIKEVKKTKEQTTEAREVTAVARKGKTIVTTVTPDEYRFCQSSKIGSKLIVWRGFRYGKGNKLHEGKTDRYWRCTSTDGNSRCRAFILLNDDQSLSAHHLHSHPPPTKKRAKNVGVKKEDKTRSQTAEKTKNKAGASGNAKNTVTTVNREEYNFSESSKTGSTLLVWQGYRYGKVSKVYGGKTDRYWRCTSHSNTIKCSAFVLLNDDHSLSAHNVHSHPAHVEKELLLQDSHSLSDSCLAPEEKDENSEDIVVTVNPGEYEVGDSTSTGNGSAVIIWRGFRYGKVNKEYNGQQDRYWHCTRNGSKSKCRAFLILNDNSSLSAHFSHSHLPPSQKEVLEEQEHMEDQEVDLDVVGNGKKQMNTEVEEVEVKVENGGDDEQEQEGETANVIENVGQINDVTECITID